MNKNNKIFMIACVVNGMSFSMILPLLAPLVRKLKLTELQGGAIVSIGSLLMALAAMYIARHQQKYSIYKLLSCGFIGMSVTWAMFSGVMVLGLYAMTTGAVLFILLILTRASTGVFMAMPQIALQSYVMTHETTDQARSQQMAKFSAFVSLGMLLGPLFTALLVIWGMVVAIWTAVLILAIFSILIVSMYQHTEKSKEVFKSEKQLASALEAQNVLSLKPIFLWLILGFILYLAIVTLNLTAGFYIQDHFQITPQQGAIYFSQCSVIMAISLILMQISVVRYLKWSLNHLLWIGLLSLLCGLILSIMTNKLIIFQLTYILYGVTVACLTPVFTTGAAQSAPQNMQKKVAAWCVAIQALGFIFGPLISTGLYKISYHYPFYMLIILVVSIIICFVFKCVGSHKILIFKV